MCGRTVVDCQREGIQKNERAKGLKLVKGEVEVSKETEGALVSKGKTEECAYFFKK